MTAPAARRASRARSCAISVAPAAAFLLTASPATAQAGVAVSIFSDDRFRGYSLSDGRPVGILDLSYDAANGLYGALSGSVVATRHDGLQPLGLQLNAGYARRLPSGLTVDLGAVHSNYSRYSGRSPSRSYTEIYAGLTGKRLSSRLYVSPDYLKPGAWSLYGEIDGNVPAGSKLRFTAHVGMLVPLESGGYEDYRTQFDWRLGITRAFGPVSLHAAWTGAQPRHDLYPATRHAGNALVVGLSWVL